LNIIGKAAKEKKPARKFNVAILPFTGTHINFPVSMAITASENVGPVHVTTD